MGADCRLAGMEPFGGSGQMPFFGDHLECAELIEFHNFLSACFL
jgi:hypothetical protein